MSGVIARVVPQRRTPLSFTPEQHAERAALALANAPDGHCPKCGGHPILLGTKYAENLPRQCFKCAHKYEFVKP